MSHTYSRTSALLDGFASSFAEADSVILHKIYASARENNDKGISGRVLFEKTQGNHPSVVYFEENLDALPFLMRELKEGDLFITLGAGDNWQLGRALFEALGGTL
jgi:UDP-N-acetylmuramate--alanine ligase